MLYFSTYYFLLTVNEKYVYVGNFHLPTSSQSFLAVGEVSLRFLDGNCIGPGSYITSWESFKDKFILFRKNRVCIENNLGFPFLSYLFGDCGTEALF